MLRMCMFVFRAHAHNFTPVAQLAERRTPNPKVGGSSPSGRAIFVKSFFVENFLLW